MALDVVGAGLERSAQALEQHDADVDAAIAFGCDSTAEAIEERVVECCEIEPGPAVGGGIRSGACPRLWCHAQLEVAARGLPAELLPPPQTDGVVAVLLEEVEVRVVVESLRFLQALRARTHAVSALAEAVRAGEPLPPQITPTARAGRLTTGREEHITGVTEGFLHMTEFDLAQPESAMGGS